MKFTSTLLAVRDMERSKQFYREVLGLTVEADYGANVVLTGGIALQSLESWAGFLDRSADEVRFMSLSGELYFEEEDLSGFLVHLTACRVPLVTSPITHDWGQRVVRFFDPDGHIVEVGEPLEAVVRRFYAEGLKAEAIAKRMGVPLDFVKGV